MNNIDFSKYTDDELRQMLKNLVSQLTEKQRGEVIEELKKTL